jgi:hypothetical protein
VSHRAHRFVRTTVSGLAGLFAFTVVITSRPAVPPASAAPDKPAPARPVPTVQSPIERGWSQVHGGLPDPRQRLFNLRR